MLIGKGMINTCANLINSMLECFVISVGIDDAVVFYLWDMIFARISRRFLQLQMLGKNL